MNIARLISLLAAVSLGLIFGQESAVQPPSPVLQATGVDALEQDALQEAFHALRRGYIKKDVLDDSSLNRAALAGLLKRLEFGARLIPPGEDEIRYEEREVIAFRPEKTVLYLQVGPAGRAQIEACREELTKASAEGVEVLLLDLRGDTQKAPFAHAASFLDLLLERSQRLFEIRRPSDSRGEVFVSKTEPIWAGEIVVLVGAQSGANAEVTAAVLQQLLPERTRIMGAVTRGAAVRYERATLLGDAVLEYAVAEVLLPDGSSFYQEGVTPDYSVITDAGTPPDTWDEVTKILSPIVRPRFNEAALVAGTYPELSYKLARSAGQQTQWDEALPRDRTLSAAYDMIRSVRFLGVGEEEVVEIVEEELSESSGEPLAEEPKENP